MTTKGSAFVRLFLVGFSRSAQAWQKVGRCVIFLTAMLIAGGDVPAQQSGLAPRRRKRIFTLGDPAVETPWSAESLT